MDRKMRARKANSEAKAKSERRSRPVVIAFANQDSGTEVTAGLISTEDGEIEPVKILLDHESKAFEVLPEKSEMN
jgi:hypothetical protein